MLRHTHSSNLPMNNCKILLFVPISDDPARSQTTAPFRLLISEVSSTSSKTGPPPHLKPLLHTAVSPFLLINIIPVYNISRKKSPIKVSIHQNPLSFSQAQLCLVGSLYFDGLVYIVFCQDPVEKITKENMR